MWRSVMEISGRVNRAQFARAKKTAPGVGFLRQLQNEKQYLFANFY
jgi:hypothetical protein